METKWVLAVAGMMNFSDCDCIVGVPCARHGGSQIKLNLQEESHPGT
jgi:hypothetical protein